MSTVYTSESKNGPGDHELSEFVRETWIDQLEEKVGGDSLIENLGRSGKIEFGNYVLGVGFAHDYLNYLKEGGNLDIEGYRKYRWDGPST